jgi:hypothetical protein
MDRNKNNDTIVRHIILKIRYRSDRFPRAFEMSRIQELIISRMKVNKFLKETFSVIGKN